MGPNRVHNECEFNKNAEERDDSYIEKFINLLIYLVSYLQDHTKNIYLNTKAESL